MKRDNSYLRLYAVTDHGDHTDAVLARQVEEAVKGAITCLQLRQKEGSDRELLPRAVMLREITSSYGVPFIINDRIDLALWSDADGVHVGQEDLAAKQVREKIGKDKILGVSVQSAQQAAEAEKAGADYLGAGAVFPSPTKPGPVPVTIDQLKDICRNVEIPVVAIGGITAENIYRLADSGIVGVAVVSAVFSQPEIKKAVTDLRQSLLVAGIGNGEKNYYER